jgi:surfeit locus 1 family protein
VKTKGTYVGDMGVYVGPRSDPTPNSGASGHFVVAPLKLDDGTFVLVNRGWIPRESTAKLIKSATEHSALFPNGPISVVGVFQPSETKVGLMGFVFAQLMILHFFPACNI